MVLGHRHRSSSLSGGRGDSKEDSADEDETVVSSEQGNVLQHIISQLRPGADLSRITLPTFILEPRSMLERITNFMAHPEIMLPIPEIDDPVARFVEVTKFYLSGWHIKPPGVKKPLNPILGETFTGWWDYGSGKGGEDRGYYISEQTSHHPPKSSYFFMAPRHGIRIDGCLKPRSKFLGNSVGSFMEGIAVMRFLNRNGERYFITQPNMYARGILFGKMKYELGDTASVKSPELNLEATIEFKVKGWVSGSYNSIGGYIKDTKSGKNLYELSGYWNGEMSIKDLATGKKQVIFDASRAKPSYPKSRPVDEQAEKESQRLWQSTVQAIKKADHNMATDEKSRIEDAQRREAAERGQDNPWQPKLFRKAPPGDEENLDWVIDAEVDGKASPEKQVEQILAIAPILPGQKAGQDYQQEKSLPSRSSKAPPPSYQSQQQQTQQARSGGGGASDLIDFGQNDGGPAPQQPQKQQSWGSQNPGLQQPLQPTQSQVGDPLRRMDSLGNEETFMDAES
ncbi:Oxysterol-binding protein OBPa [Vermiconidia calcicola]|uniref:Oxysterol-binding protein OBPa n=1 Tax=Vermiconidia calcicola TaxID=1690605 RepID=A0ACC3NZM1_9PEZI|nr:Oxysterol-binding protein OBPa [Vermiconidia calcicola]